jgi:hypothetical protein
VIIKQPILFNTFTSGRIIDYTAATYVLQDQGRFEFDSPRDTRSAFVTLQNVRLIDEREDKSKPAISFRQMKNVTLRNVTVNKADIACRFENVWDSTIESCAFVYGVDGLQIVRDCNNIVCRDLRIEQMTGDSLVCRRSRQLVFERSCKIHGIPTDDVKRSLAAFGDCETVVFETRLMHGKPHERNGLVLFYGKKTGRVIFRPLITNTAEGESLMLRNTPDNMRLINEPIDWREPSLVDPK